MKGRLPALAAILAGLVFLLAGTCLAESGPVPPLTGRVVDAADMLVTAEEQEIRQAILQFEKQTGGQFVVLTVRSLNGESIESLGIRVANAWQIGYAGKDNGLVLIIALSERATRLEVGRGYEGPITDAYAGDLLRGLQREFRGRKYTEGILYVINGAAWKISGDPLAGHDISLPSTEAEKLRNQVIGLILMVLFLITVGYYWAKTWVELKRNEIFSSRGISSSFGGFGGRGGFSGGGGGFSGGGASGGW